MKRKLLLAIIVASALLLAGCVTIRIETRLNPDLSGEKSMIIAMDDSTLEMMKSAATPGAGGAQETDPFASVKEDTKGLPPNARVEDFHDDFNKQTGVKVIIPFANLDELVALSKTGHFSSTDKVEIQRSGDTVTMRITMNQEQLTSEMGSAASGGGAAAGPTPAATLDPAMAKQMADMFTFMYSIAPAGEIVSYSPQEGSKFDAATNAVTWRLDLTAQKFPAYEITWKPGGLPAAPAQPAAGAGETPAAPPGAPATTLPPAPKTPPVAPKTTPPSLATATPPILGGLKSCGPCAGCLPGLVLPLGGMGLAGFLGRKRLRF
jgi:hypothetical protein